MSNVSIKVTNVKKKAFLKALNFVKKALDKNSDFAIIKLLKPPVLTARHGGVLFFRTRT